MLTTLLLIAALQGGTTPAPVSQNTTEATAEGVEVFRRLLSSSIETSFTKKGSEENLTVQTQSGIRMRGFVTTLYAGHHTVQHSRAFHLPGVGLFLTLDASLPVVAREEDAPKDEKERTEGEWERIRREVRGDIGGEAIPYRRLRLGTPEPAPEIDPVAIEQLIDVTLMTVSLHAGRIEELGPQETVTVALRLSGQDRTWMHSMNGSGSVNGFFAPFGNEDEGDEDQQGMTQDRSIAYVLGMGTHAREQNLVIRIPISQLMGVEGGAEALRKHAQVNLY